LQPILKVIIGLTAGIPYTGMVVAHDKQASAISLTEIVPSGLALL